MTKHNESHQGKILPGFNSKKAVPVVEYYSRAKVIA